MTNHICQRFRTLAKEFQHLNSRAHRDQAGKVKKAALELYRQMELKEQELSLLWLEKRLAIFPEQLSALLDLIGELYSYHEEERIFLSSSNLFVRTGLLLAARPEFQLL